MPVAGGLQVWSAWQVPSPHEAHAAIHHDTHEDHPHEPPAAQRAWTISVFGGPTVTPFLGGPNQSLLQPYLLYENAWHLEVQRQSAEFVPSSFVA